MEGKTRYSCPKCGQTFADNAHLRRHQGRKTPCELILGPSHQQGPHACRYCGRGFASKTSMYRHIRKSCKVANSEEGMERLMEHTLERQVTEMRAENALMREQVAELATLMKSQLALGPARPRAAEIGQVNLGPVINAQTVQQNFIISPWDGERRLHVDVGQIAAAFAENTRLQEYARLEGHQLTDLEIAPPYVTELLMDLTKRAHADPSARNVYLNPRRADQALVHMACGRWEVLPLGEATRLLFDGVANSARQVVMTRAELKQLPLEAQNSLSMAGLLYEDEPEEYVKRARGPMAAHLANTAPADENA